MPKFSTLERFIEPYNEIPGPAAYDTTRPQTRSGGKIGKSTLPSSLAPLNNNPGPNSYRVSNPNHRINGGIRFQAGGKGRVPFPDPPPTPGPNSYRIKHPGQPIRLRRKVMGAFASGSKRDSFIGKVPEGPGIGRYTVPTGNRWELPSYVKLPPNFHTFGANVSRYIYMGNLNHSASIPGPGAYEIKGMGVKRPSTGPQESRSQTPKPRALGKQFERGVMPEHTFGADKDRFKDSFCGRLDLIRLYPGPCAYDVVASQAALESHAAAGATSRPASPLQSRPASPCTFGAGENRHSYAGDLHYHANIPGPGQYTLPGMGGILDGADH